LTAISLLPLNSDETAGRFRVWLFLSEEPPILLWDRKVEGGFPELKVLVSDEYICPSYAVMLIGVGNIETTPSGSYTTWCVFGAFG
jgi:hypothetical protein